MNFGKIVSGSVATLILVIMGVLVSLVASYFVPLLLGSTTLNTTMGQTFVNTIFPILLLLIPLFALIGGMVITVLMVKGGNN